MTFFFVEVSPPSNFELIGGPTARFLSHTAVFVGTLLGFQASLGATV